MDRLCNFGYCRLLILKRVIVALMIYSFHDWLFNRHSRMKYIELVYIALPFVLSSLHFIYLKIQYGCFFYPEHIDYFKETWNSIHRDLRYIWNVLWKFEGRVWISILGAAGIIYNFRNTHALRFLAMAIITYFGYITFYREWPEPNHFWKSTIWLFFNQINLDLNNQTEYAIFTNIDYEPNHLEMDSLRYQLIERIEIGEAWGEIYQRSSQE